MRSIPSALLDRVKKKWQVPAENANPEMKVYLSRGFINDLFQVFTIQEGALLTELDATTRRPSLYSEPAEAFAVVVNNGVASVKSKPLPYDDQIPWVDEYVIGAAEMVAIEFDGAWYYSPSTERGWNFVTEDVPWIFWTNNWGGTLYAQKGNDVDSRIELATAVNKIRAIRGWYTVEEGNYNDQGLIVAYTKTNGTVYYRTLAIQLDGTKQWELERVVSGLPTPVSDLALMRTNDFRVAFIVEYGGEAIWLVTTRNWSAMSIQRERITAKIQDVTFEVHPIVYTDTFETEHIAADINPLFLVCTPIYPSIKAITNPTEWTLLVEFTHPISQDMAGWETAFIVKDSILTEFDVLSTEAGPDSKTMKLNMERFSSGTVDFTLWYDDGMPPADVPRLTCNNDGCEFAIETQSVVFTPIIVPPKGYETEQISALITPTFVVSYVTYTKMYEPENLSADITATFVVTNVGGNPL